MNQSRAFMISFIFAAAAMGLVYYWVSEQEEKAKMAYGTGQSVVVAKTDINEFEEIQKDMLRIIVVPQKFVQPGAQKDISAFEGTVASAPMRKGEQILSTKVLAKGADTGLASQVAISKRAISISVSEVTGVTKLLKPGDRVDVIASIPYQTDKGQESEVKTIMQNVHVLAVGQQIQNQIPQVFRQDPLSGATTAINLRGANYNTVTIEVSLIEAQGLIYVIESGADLFMTLRNPIDRAIVAVPTTAVDEVLGPESKKAKRERAKLTKRARPTRRTPARVKTPKPPARRVSPFSTGRGDLVP